LIATVTVAFIAACVYAALPAKRLLRAILAPKRWFTDRKSRRQSSETAGV